MFEILRRCRKCKKLKFLNKFPKNCSCVNGRERTCRICGPQKRNKKWRKKKGYQHTSKIRRESLIKSHKISLKTYDNIIKTQNNTCKICGKAETKKSHYTKQPRKLAIDHDHKTGKVRGLLCSNCNNALGFAGDDTRTLRRMIYYIDNDGNI